MSSPLASNRVFRIVRALAVFGVLGLSACAKRPATGIMIRDVPGANAAAAADGKKIYATPDPSVETSDPEPTTPATNPSPAPSEAPDPFKWIRPNPVTSPTPWNPFPNWPFPSPKPSARPVTPPSPVPPTSKWPSPKVGPKVEPTKPTTTSNDRTEIEVPTELLKFFTRSFGQAFGVYDNGRLERPDLLPNAGEGFLKVFQDRNRGYGSLDLISLIEASAKEIHRDLPATEVVQIGDIASRNGGRLGGHGSHQNGLDADIVYFKRDHRPMRASGSEKNPTGFDEDFVDKQGELTANFDIDANWRFIQLLVGTGHVDRIFADSHIKKAFCEYAVAKGMREAWRETLRKLRHWPNHQDHLHVRLTCPANSRKCKPIPPIPAGDGCAPLLDRGRGIIRMDGFLDFESEPVADEHGC